MPSDEDPTPVVAVHLDGEDLGGFGCDGRLLDAETALADLADQVQEILDEDIRGGWPLCPEHAGHLVAEVAAGTAVWRCPRGEIVSPIGQLPALPASN